MTNLIWFVIQKIAVQTNLFKILKSRISESISNKSVFSELVNMTCAMWILDPFSFQKCTPSYSFGSKCLLHLCYTILASLQVHILFSFCRLELIFFSTSFSASHRKNGGKSGKIGRLLKPKTVFKINVAEEKKFLLEFLSVLFLPVKEIQKLIAKLL